VSTQLTAASPPPLFSLIRVEKTANEPPFTAAILAFLATRRRNNSE
jgi:hypothetical protein